MVAMNIFHMLRHLWKQKKQKMEKKKFICIRMTVLQCGDVVMCTRYRHLKQTEINWFIVSETDRYQAKRSKTTREREEKKHIKFEVINLSSSNFIPCFFAPLWCRIGGWLVGWMVGWCSCAMCESVFRQQAECIAINFETGSLLKNSCLAPFPGIESMLCVCLCVCTVLLSATMNKSGRINEAECVQVVVVEQHKHHVPLMMLYIAVCSKILKMPHAHARCDWMKRISIDTFQ